jgi:FkbM family methyltransferase
MIDRISQHTFLSGPIDAQSVALDLGMNRGNFSRSISARYSCRVVAVEAVAELVDARAAESVLVAAVSGRSGHTEITVDRLDTESSTILAAARSNKVNSVNVETRTVPMVGLAEIFEYFGLIRVDLMKVDIEGAELDFIEAAPDDLIRSCAQVSVEFHDKWYPELAQSTLRARQRMRRLGFWECRFTPDNRDVLFVNLTLIPLSLVQRLYVSVLLRNIAGLQRAIGVLARRFLK